MSGFDFVGEKCEKPLCRCPVMIASGQAITQFICANCLKPEWNGNTRTPKICDACERKKKFYGRCPHCLGFEKWFIKETEGGQPQ